MTTDEAVKLAELDLSALYTAVSFTVQGGLERGARSILADGSMLSPSWRALQGGSLVWNAYEETDGGNSWSVDEAYVETLDNGTDDDRWGDDLYLYWEEGILWVQRHY